MVESTVPDGCWRARGRASLIFRSARQSDTEHQRPAASVNANSCILALKPIRTGTQSSDLIVQQRSSRQ